ncbi:MAG: hypothetical protein R2849_12810 [Thermomicrobiales bacterium]
MTVFSPLCEALHFTETREMFFEHYEQSPSVVHGRWPRSPRICERTSSTHWIAARTVSSSRCKAVPTRLTRDQYRELGRPYDLVSLQGSRDELAEYSPRPR